MIDRLAMRCAAGALAWLLSACAAQLQATTAPVQVSGLEIHNQTGAWVAAVRLLVPATGRFVSCGNIAPGAHCATGFPEQAYAGQAIEIAWSEGGQIYSTGALHLNPAVEVVRAGKALVRVVLSGPGAAGAWLVEAP